VRARLAVNPERLHPSRLARLPPAVAVPRYDRARVTTGIVHLGVGSFHRAHQALYVDELLASGETDWGISGVGLFPIQFVQTPTHVIILYEYLWTHRVIPIGGKHPEDMSPSFMGDSVGRWEGNTFVVDVVGFKPGGWLTGGLVTSDALHLTERYTRVDRDQLNYEVTIEDPKVLTKPFTQRTTLMLREGARLREYSCAENNMDPGVYEKMLKDPAASQSFIRGK